MCIGMYVYLIQIKVASGAYDLGDAIRFFWRMITFWHDNWSKLAPLAVNESTPICIFNFIDKRGYSSILVHKRQLCKKTNKSKPKEQADIIAFFVHVVKLQKTL